MSTSSATSITALHRLPAVSSRVLTILIESDIIGLPSSQWSARALHNIGIEPERAAVIMEQLPTLDVGATRAALEQHRISVVTLLDETYPTLLREIPSPPPVLYVRGRVSTLQATMLAVVGTRQPTPYGLHVTKQLLQPVTRAGIGVVSGLALGIDGAAHRVALEESVPTVAVLGCGVDRFYPWQHHDLADQIIGAGGAIISEFPLGAEPKREHFPQRNRIISGLSRAVLLVEAGAKSGALITAKYAVDQNREVLAVPGLITSPQSVGPIHWIQLGAKAIHTANDILEVFALSAQSPTSFSRPQPGDPIQQTVLKNVTAEPLHVDVISASCRLEASVVSATLVLLELDGRVAHHGGMYYSLTP